MNTRTWMRFVGWIEQEETATGKRKCLDNFKRGKRDVTDSGSREGDELRRDKKKKRKLLVMVRNSGDIFFFCHALF